MISRNTVFKIPQMEQKMSTKKKLVIMKTLLKLKIVSIMTEMLVCRKSEKQW